MFFKKEEINSLSFREYLSFVISGVKAGLIYLSKGGLGAFLKILATLAITFAVQIAISLVLMIGMFLSLILPLADIISLLLSVAALLVILPIIYSLASFVSWESYNLSNKNKAPPLGVVDFVKTSFSADKLKYFFLLSIMYAIVYGVFLLLTTIFSGNFLITLLVGLLSVFVIYYPFSSLVSYWYFNGKKAKSLSFNDIMASYVENAKAFLGIGGVKLFLSYLIVGLVLMVVAIILALIFMALLALGGILAFVVLLPVFILLGVAFSSILYSFSFIPFFLLTEKFKKA